MKYLIPYNESTKFLNLKDVLETINDMCLDIKDDNFDVNFGVMSYQWSEFMSTGYANFRDTELDDLIIRKASWGKEVIYIKFDISKNRENFKNEEYLENFINTIVSVYKYILNEDLIIKGIFTHESVFIKNRDNTWHGRKLELFSHENIDYLINHIDWSRKEKLNNIVSKVDNLKIKDEENFRSIFDVRILFTGQPLIEESKDFKTDINMKATEDDYESIKDIIYNFNQDNYEGDNKEFEATVGTVRTKHSSGRSYLIMIDDKSNFYNGFLISDVSELLLRLISEFGSDTITCGILFIGDPVRKNITLSKHEKWSLPKPRSFFRPGEGKISNLVVYIDII
jgi:hypothetical protein